MKRFVKTGLHCLFPRPLQNVTSAPHFPGLFLDPGFGFPAHASEFPQSPAGTPSHSARPGLFRAKPPPSRAYRRLQPVLLLAEGREVSEVAQLSRASSRSIYSWCTAYLRSRTGPELLGNKARGGRPKSLPPQVSADALETILRHSPLTYGYQSAGCTIALLRIAERFRGISSE